MAQRKTKDKEAAKKKVDDLLKGTILGKEEPKEEEVDVLEQAAEAKDTSWLTDEITRLQDENTQLKTDLNKAFDDINRLRAGGATDDSEVKAGVRKLFRDIEDAHLGRNPERKIYKVAVVKILLEKFLKTFPFLMKK